jgi:hypothetical protein
MSDAPPAAPLTRRDIEAKIVALAWQDEAFRAKFVADPKGQFEERLGTKLPDSLNLTVHQEDENSLHFVIPMKPRENLGELSDEELEKVAGGTDVVVGTPLIIFMTISVAVSVTAGVSAATAPHWPGD